MSTRITTSHPNRWASSVTLHCEGPLDCISYRSLIEVVIEEIRKGANQIVIDLSHVDRISLAGMVGLFLAGVLLEDNQLLAIPLKDGQDLDKLDGWEVIHDLYKFITRGVPFRRLQLADPNQGLIDCLTTVGLHPLMRVVHSDEEPCAA